MAKSHGKNNVVGSYIERIERVEEDKSVINEDLKQLFKDAKNDGVDVKVLRDALRERKLERKHGKAELREHRELVSIYVEAAGEQSL